MVILRTITVWVSIITTAVLMILFSLKFSINMMYCVIFENCPVHEFYNVVDSGFNFEKRKNG